MSAPGLKQRSGLGGLASTLLTVYGLIPSLGFYCIPSLIMAEKEKQPKKIDLTVRSPSETHIGWWTLFHRLNPSGTNRL